MRSILVFFISLVIFTDYCSAQNGFYINNEGDAAFGTYDTVKLSGRNSRFIITQKRATSSNYTYFEGPILLNKADIDSFYCQRTFFRKFVMKNCVLKSVAVFDSTPSAQLLIDSNIFQKGLRINGDFNNIGLANFSFVQNKVYGKTIFSGIKLNNSKFDYTNFYHTVIFDGCIVNNVFYKVIFQDSISFINSSNEIGNFIACNFHKSFIANQFTTNLNFDSSSFGKGLILSSLNSNIHLSFKYIVLPDSLDLSNNPTISFPIDLTIVRFHNGSEKCRIFLYKTDISKIQLDYKYFKLVFKSLDGYEMTRNEKEIAYEALLKNFKDHGQNESFELLDIEYKNFKNGWFILPHYWNCYGYHKEWIFIWTLVLLVMFTVTTFFRIDKLTRFVYKVNHIPNLPSLKQTWKSKHRILLFRRLWMSLMYTSTIFFLFLLKVDNIKFKNWRGVLYLIVMYAAGLVCIAYIANFVLQK